jgi:AcrR family transcriptional regulator
MFIFQKYGKFGDDMTTTSSTPAIYLKNYENHIERILESAQMLFLRNGIESVTMNAIADEARIARKTLYKYFPTKQEIALAILKNFIEKHKDDFGPGQIPEGNGFQRLEFFLMESVNMLDRYPEFFRFLVEFNVLYAKDGDPEQVRQTFALGNDLLSPIIRDGIADGSIRADFEPEFLVAAIFNQMSALDARFALTGTRIGAEYGQSARELHQAILRIFLRGIQCPAKPK